jgi:hypothetical protein
MTTSSLATNSRVGAAGRGRPAVFAWNDARTFMPAASVNDDGVLAPTTMS